jgi:hypothetical protein
MANFPLAGFDFQPGTVNPKFFETFLQKRGKKFGDIAQTTGAGQPFPIPSSGLATEPGTPPPGVAPVQPIVPASSAATPPAAPASSAAATAPAPGSALTVDQRYELLQQGRNPFEDFISPDKAKELAELKRKALEKGGDLAGLAFAMNDPSNLVLQAGLTASNAALANRMALENLAVQEAASIRKSQREEARSLREQGRNFTFQQLGNLFTSVPRAFSPMPYQLSQEVTANIANITSPSNVRPIEMPRTAGFNPTNYSYYR